MDRNAQTRGAKRVVTSAGGVVFRRVADGAAEGAIEVAIAEQRDRLTGDLNTRLPKGRLDPGETLEQAAVREVAEEVGLRCRVVGDLGCEEYVFRQKNKDVSKRVHYFLLEWTPGEPLPLDGEMERVYWCSLDHAERALTFETEQRAVARARAALTVGAGA